MVIFTNEDDPGLPIRAIANVIQFRKIGLQSNIEVDFLKIALGK